MDHTEQTIHTTLGALREAAPSLSLVGDPSTPIVGISCNTWLQDVRPGVLYAPLNVSTSAVASLAAKAVAKGAAAVLVGRRLDIDAPQLIAPDIRAPLASISAAFYGYAGKQVKCIGVTGTDGKTTTTFLIESILQSAGLVSGLIGSIAMRVGAERWLHQTFQTTPEAPYVQHLLRRMADAGVEWAVLEATSHGLALHRLDEIRFSVAAITFVSQDHLDFHGTIAAYRRAKAILFERVAESNGVAVINADDPASREMVNYVGSARVISYSATGDVADIRATDIDLGCDATRFTLSTPSGVVTVALPLLGEFNVANALCAAAVASAIGVSLADIARGLHEAIPVPGLFTRVDAGQPFDVLIDEAKFPAQLVHALEVARGLARGRVILLVGGSSRTSRDQLQRKGLISALAADYTVITSQDPRLANPTTLIAAIAQGARAVGGREGETFDCVIDREEAIRHALAAAKSGDCVVLAGMGAEREFDIGGESRSWDEAAIARNALTDLGYRPANTEPAVG
jgi:UDP-N-acetylmuramoyl-L-alanyl-D-glutamate--2,6-diaminopimelate ligase